MPVCVVANAQHWPVIRELWQEGFPDDSNEDIALFQKMLSHEATCLLYRVQGQFASMLFVIPAQLCGQRWWYVYAAATRKSCRGRGYFAALLEQATAFAKQKGAAGLFLRPATPSLFSYYARLGFLPAFSVEKFDWKAQKLYSKTAWSFVKTGYAEQRNRALEKMGVDFVKWPDAAVDYAVVMAEQSGGGAVVREDGIALCEREGGRLIVRELLCDIAERARLIDELSCFFTCQRATVFTPSFKNENIPPFGMIRPCDGKYAARGWYMGLTFE